MITERMTQSAWLLEEVLWECLQTMQNAEELQVATMLSLSLGSGHSYEARSILGPIFRLLRPRSIIETGTNHGLSSAVMWALGRAVGQPPQITTFDIERSTLASQIWRRIGASGDITPVQGDSATEVSRRCGPWIQFVLIDGDHSYSGAERDWRAVEPILADRSAVLCDNMQHPSGCGRFFGTLQPLWFHPELAIVTRGLSAVELRSMFVDYRRRVLPLWLGALPGQASERMGAHLRTLDARLESAEPDAEDLREIASLCRALSADAEGAQPASFPDLMAVSARYGIGSLTAARRARIVRSMPGWLRPWLSRAYRMLRPEPHA